MAQAAVSLLTPYDGTTCVKEFIKRFNVNTMLAGMDDDARLLLLPNLLTGKAERLFNGFTEEQKGSIELALNALQASCSQSQEQLLEAFYDRKPAPGEKLSSFAVSLQLLLDKAIPTMGANEKGILLRRQLGAFLPAHMRAIISFNATKQWDELLTSIDSSMPHVKASALGDASHGMFASAGDLSIKAEPVELNATAARASNIRSKFNGNCNYCKKPGHKERQCYKKMSDLEKRVDNSRGDGRNDHGGRQGGRVNRSQGNTRGGYGNRQLTSLELGNLSGSESNTVTISKAKGGRETELYALGASVPLLQRKVRVSFDGINSTRVKALFDGGATNSFIRLSSLDGELQDMVKAFQGGTFNKLSDLGIQKEYLTIRSATESIKECCVVLPLQVKMSGWCGIHRFIVTDRINDKEMILGRDFLKANSVQIDHGNDKIWLASGSEDCSWTSVEQETCVVANTIEIAPHTEQLVKVSVASTANLVAFTPQELSDGLLFAHSIDVRASDGTIRVSALNPTSETIVVKANSAVGTITSQFDVVGEGARLETNVNTLDSSESSNDKVVAIRGKRDVIALDTIRYGYKLSDQQLKQIKALILAHCNAFQINPDDVGLTHLIQHGIDTGDHKPIRQKQFRLPQALREEVTKQVNEMLKNNLIEPSVSPWCSPMMIIKQKTREGVIKFRFVIDMRKLNEITVKDSYPLPRIDQTLDALGGACYFSVIDMARGYFQVPLKMEDREKTAFIANDKLYQFKVMALGLSNAPSTYSRLMDMVLNGLTYKYCLVYLDDTIIYSKTFADHLVHLNEILKRVSEAGLKLRPDKCTFAADEVSYLGYVITTEGVRPDSNKTKSIMDIGFPKTNKAMIRFLGAVNFYRDFIPRYSFIASKLYKMSQSAQKFKAKLKDPSVYDAFESLKSALVSAPVLAYPDFSRPFIIQCDASNVAIGAVIGQLIDGHFRPVMYGSRHLTQTESRYSTTERELLAIVWSAKRFSPYIYGRHVTFVTDHQPLVTMRSLKEPMGRIGRLLNKIQDMDYTLIYQPGSSNFTADLLSRPESSPEEVGVHSIQLQVNSSVNWAKEQGVDDVLGRVVHAKLSGEPLSGIEDTKEASMWANLIDSLVLRDGILILIVDNQEKIVVPSHLVGLILSFYHDSSLAGHRDFEKTYNSIKAKYFWYQMASQIKKYCSTCHLCQTKKHFNSANRAPLKPIQVDGPWVMIGLDVAGPLKTTAGGNSYVLVACDYFSKFCVARATPDFTALTTAKFVFDEIVCRFGMPYCVISDHGVNFKAQLFANLCKLCGIKTANSSFYHPPGNGLVERMNKSLKQILTMYVDSAHANWDVHLQAAVSAYNSSIHSSIGCSPYEVLFARKPRLLADIILATPMDFNGKSIDDYLVGLRDSASRIQDRVGKQLAISQARQKAQYDRFVNDRLQFKVGDYVLLTNDRSESKAFKDRALGPFKVLKVFNEVNYKLECVVSGKIQNVHYNRLRTYNLRDGTGPFSNSIRFFDDIGIIGSKTNGISSGSKQEEHGSCAKLTENDLNFYFGLLRAGFSRRNRANGEIIVGLEEDANVDDPIAPAQDKLPHASAGTTGGALNTNGSDGDETMVSANTSNSQDEALFFLDYDFEEEEESGKEETGKEGTEQCPECGKSFKRLRMHCFSQHKDYYASRWGGEGM